MSQRHSQFGIFHITTNALDRKPWCTVPGAPMILIETLCLVRDLQLGNIYRFCVLPDHMHIIMSPGPKGLSAFMHSFKTNSSKNIRDFLKIKGGNALFNGWQAGFHDERIQSSGQCGAARNYVEGNAAQHGLVREPSDWPWTSIHFQDRLDMMELWLD